MWVGHEVWGGDVFDELRGETSGMMGVIIADDARPPAAMIYGSFSYFQEFES